MPLRSMCPGTKGKIVGQKAPLKLKDIWAIRVRLQTGNRTRESLLAWIRGGGPSFR
jgi:hypothetical protein